MSNDNNRDADLAIARVSHLLTSWEHDAEEYDQKLADYGLEVLEAPMVRGAGVNHRGELDSRSKNYTAAGAASPGGKAWLAKSEFVDVEQERGPTPKQQHQQSASHKTDNNSLHRLSPMRAGALVPVRTGPAEKVAATKKAAAAAAATPTSAAAAAAAKRPPFSSSSTSATRKAATPPLLSSSARTSALRNNKPPVVIKKPSVLHGLKLEEPEPEPADWWHDHDEVERRAFRERLQQQEEAEAEAAAAEAAAAENAFKSRPKLRPQSPEEVRRRVEQNDPASNGGRFQKSHRTPPPSSSFAPGSSPIVAVGTAPTSRPTTAREALDQIDKKIPASRRIPTSPAARFVHRNESGRLVPHSSQQQQQEDEQQQQQKDAAGMPSWLRDQYKRMWEKKRAEKNATQEMAEKSRMRRAEQEQQQRQQQLQEEEEETQQHHQQSSVSFVDDHHNHHFDPSQHHHQGDEPPPQHECICDVSEISNNNDDASYRQQRFEHHRRELTAIDDQSQRAFADRNNSAAVANYHFAEAERHMAEATLESARFRNNNSNNNNSSSTTTTRAVTPPARISYQTALGRRYTEMPMTVAEHEQLERQRAEQREREEEARRQRQQASVQDTHRAAIQRMAARRETAGYEQRKSMDEFWSNDVSSPEGLREARAQQQAERDFYKTAAELAATPHSRGAGAGGVKAATATTYGSIMHHNDSATSRMFSRNSAAVPDEGGGGTAVCVTQTIEDTGPPLVIHFVSPLGNAHKVPTTSSALTAMAGDAAVRSFYGDLESAAPDANSRRYSTYNNNSSNKNGNSGDGPYSPGGTIILSGDGSSHQHTVDVNKSQLTHSMLHDLHDERWDAVPNAQYREQEGTRGISGTTRSSQLQWRDSLRDNTRSNVRTPFSTTVTPMLSVDSTMYTMPKAAPIDAQGRVIGAPSGIQKEINNAGAAGSGSTLGAPTAMISQTQDLSMRPLCPQNTDGKSFSQLYQEKQERAVREKQQHQQQLSDGAGGTTTAAGGGGGESPHQDNNSNNNSRSSSANAPGATAANNGPAGSREEWLLRKKQLWRERASKKRQEEMRLQDELRVDRERQGSKRPNAMHDISNSNRNTAMTSLTGKESFASPLLGGKAKGLARRRATTPGDKYRVAVAALEKVVEENERNAALLAEAEAEETRRRRMLPPEQQQQGKKSGATVSVVSSPTITKADPSKINRGVSFSNDIGERSTAGGGGGGGLRSSSAFDGLETASAISGVTSAYSDVSGDTGTYTNATSNNFGGSSSAAAGAARPMSPKEKRKALKLELAYDRAEKFAHERPVPAHDVTRPSDQRHHHAVLSPKKVAQFLPANFSLLAVDSSSASATGGGGSNSPSRSASRANALNGGVGGVAGGHASTDIVAARAVTRAVKAAADAQERQFNALTRDTTPAWMLSAEEEDQRAEQDRQMRSEWGGVDNAAQLDAAAAAAAKRRQPWAAFRDHSKDAPARKVFGNKR